jgi:uncharacterized protein YycO
MNLENEVTHDGDFRLVEAIGSGVQLTPFEKVFDVHAVALLKPRGLTHEDWVKAAEAALSQQGKPYDNLFDLASDAALSCVELIRLALRAIPGYETRFAAFERDIARSRNLAPQMYYDCEDFEVALEIRK